jgi:hypothetical protein
MGYSESTRWAFVCRNHDVFYGRSFDESGFQEFNRLVLGNYLRTSYDNPDLQLRLQEIIDDCLTDLKAGKKILLDRTPGYYNEGDNYRFFVPFEKDVQDAIRAAIEGATPALRE